MDRNQASTSSSTASSAATPARSRERPSLRARGRWTRSEAGPRRPRLHRNAERFSQPASAIRASTSVRSPAQR
jgi:hypothetical protein